MASMGLVERLTAALAPNYRLGPELGRGGMGIVYRATDTRLGREVAIKILPPELAYREDLRKRFAREAHLAAGLSHPHIVPIHDVGEHDDLVWIVMSFVDGESVRSRVERVGPLSQALTTRVVREVAYALAYAHARGIVHRDIKPDNILLERGSDRALVGDFGIAKAAEGDASTATASGVVVGSLAYMAPEQAAGTGQVDGRADLYALGLVAYFMLSGQPPFPNVNVYSVATRTSTGEEPDFGAIPRRPAPTLRGVLQRAVAPPVEHRWASAERLLEALGPEGAAPRPIPAPIRLVVRDFTILGALASTAFIASWILGRLGPDAVILGIVALGGFNLLSSVNAFTRRGFGWPDLRDALYLDWLRRMEEDEGADRDSQQSWLLSLLSAALAGAGAIRAEAHPIVVLLATGMGFAWAKALTEAAVQSRAKQRAERRSRIPRPESKSPMLRMLDRALTLLFRPLGQGSRARTAAAGTSGSGWDATQLGKARAAARAAIEGASSLPRDERRRLGRVDEHVSALTRRVEEIHVARDRLQGIAERNLDHLSVQEAEAVQALDELRSALAAAAGNGADESAVHAALRGAEEVVSRDRPWIAKAVPEGAQHLVSLFPERGWTAPHGRGQARGLEAIDESQVETPPPEDLERLESDVTFELSRIRDVRNRWPRALEDVSRVARKAQGLALNTAAAPEGAAANPPETTAELERVLAQLLGAARRYDGEDEFVTEEISALLWQVREIEKRLDAM